MRGKVVGGDLIVAVGRITPAYAGKSGCFSGRRAAKPGSPPRMRGKDVNDFFQPGLIGITPAYAGKS